MPGEHLTHSQLLGTNGIKWGLACTHKHPSQIRRRGWPTRDYPASGQLERHSSVPEVLRGDRVRVAFGRADLARSTSRSNSASSAGIAWAVDQSSLKEVHSKFEFLRRIDRPSVPVGAGSHMYL